MQFIYSLYKNHKWENICPGKYSNIDPKKTKSSRIFILKFTHLS